MMGFSPTTAVATAMMLMVGMSVLMHRENTPLTGIGLMDAPYLRQRDAPNGRYPRLTLEELSAIQYVPHCSIACACDCVCSSVCVRVCSACVRICVRLSECVCE
jgi:hypothetical protein